jgi:phosphatidylglycerophosphatase A
MPKNVFFLMLASAFGLGLSPIAPGSCGALLGVALHLGLVFTMPASYLYRGLMLVMLIICGLHFLLTPWAQRYWQEQDPQHFVLDEVAGYLTVPLVLGTSVPLWATVIMGYLLFRGLDIIKLPPARQIDRQMHGAWGILLDDIVSGVYAALILRIFFSWR